MNYSFLTFLIFISQVFGDITPQQVHISLGEDPFSMVVTWVTFEYAPPPIILYGPTIATTLRYPYGHSNDFTYNNVTLYVHTGTLSNLEPDTLYYYKVGTKNNWSGVFNFTTFPAGNDFKFRVCVFGDLGYRHGNSIPDLFEATRKGWIDMIIHVGDIAYDLHSDDCNGNCGDKFMTELEPIFSHIPYMVIAGNHENDHQNFSHFHNRFRMPGEVGGHHNNQYYSFNLGAAHFFGVSTEHYGYMDEYGKAPILSQYNWLTSDLQEANKNRATRPWIIGYQHRPFYCSNTECHEDDEPLIRKGDHDIPGLEPVYISNKIDLVFCGHMHSYERFYPIANLVSNGGNGHDSCMDTSSVYHNAAAPAYIVTGSAGNHDPKFPFGSPHPGSACRSDDWGYTIMSVYNHTHIHLYQWSVNQLRNIDNVWITKFIGNFTAPDDPTATSTKQSTPLISITTASSSPPLINPGGNESAKWWIIGAVLIVVFSLIIIVIVHCLRRKYYERKFDGLQEAIRIKIKLSPLEVKLTHDERLKKQIDPKNVIIDFDTILGKGDNATVYKVFLKGTIKSNLNENKLKFETQIVENCHAALKLPTNFDQDEVEQFVRELDALLTIGTHDHIITLYGWTLYHDVPGLITELANTNLLQYVKSFHGKQLPTKKIVSILWQISDALEYVSSLMMVHRDVACRNILLTEGKVANQLNAKLADFGLCCYCDDTFTYHAITTNRRLPLKWLSIEALTERLFSEKSDVWAFGILCYEIFSFGKVPYLALSNYEIVEFLQAGNRLEKPNDTPDAIYELMLDCWRENPADRSKFKDIANSLKTMLENETTRYGYLKLGSGD